MTLSTTDKRETDPVTAKPATEKAEPILTLDLTLKQLPKLAKFMEDIRDPNLPTPRKLTEEPS